MPARPYWFAGLCLTLLSLTAQAEPEVSEHIAYYDVSGDTGPALLQSLDRLSPIRQDGKTFHGHTRSRVNWRFSWTAREGTCRISSVHTTVKIHMTLPRLKDGRGEVADIWARWYPKLRKHEGQHARHAVLIADEIESALHALPAKRHCEDLEEAAQATAQDLIRKLQRLDQDYDRRTTHGDSEGARFSSYLR